MKLTCSIFAAVSLVMAAQTVSAVSHSQSVNVALIPNTTGSGYDAIIGYYYGGGSAGTLQTGWFPGYNITIVPPGTITSAASLAQYDTVILYQFCNIGDPHFASFVTALVGWVQQYSGKLIIWDSDSCQSSTYLWLGALGASFERYSPGQTGAFGGSLTILDNNGLGSSSSSSPFYINTALLISNTDAVGDLNVVNENTVSPVWCAHMRGVNVNNRSGFGHMYTKIGGLIGAPDALLIYCGLDTDYISNTGGGAELRKLFLLELAHGWGPPGSPEVADLGCQAPIGNLTLTPATAVNPVPGQHTVTATVTAYNFGTGQTVPQSGVTVDFLVTSGPNAGAAGSAVSDAQGHVTFTYSTAGQGVDVIQAQATVNNVLKTATAQKTWCNAPVLLRVLAGNRGMFRLSASSGCYATTGLQVFVKDSGSSFVAGPYPSGVVVRLIKSGSASLGPITATGAQTIYVTGDAWAYAVDPLASVSALVLCKPAL